MDLSSIKIKSERTDDIPLILERLSTMNVQPLIDNHFLTHGNRTRISQGQVAVIWQTYILSLSDRRMHYVEDWARTHRHTLEARTGQTNSSRRSE